MQILCASSSIYLQTDIPLCSYVRFKPIEQNSLLKFMLINEIFPNNKTNNIIPRKP